MLVIIGSGQAGYSLAREWRRLDPATPLTIITRDDGINYYKPDLSKALAAGKDAEKLIRASTEAMAHELEATIRTHTEVTAIDTGKHTVHIGGEALPYGKLVLAIGASSIRLPIDGDAAELVLTVNDRQDYARFRERLTPGSRVLILGAGLIGCEFANDLAAVGHPVDVADIARWPLARLLPEASGQALQAALTAIGVQFHWGASVTHLQKQAGGKIVATLSDGSAITADLVLSAVGLRPNLALPKAAGLACGAGIIVDANLKTSAPDVYALGDCIEIAGRPMPFVLPIANSVRALAPTLAGTPTRAVYPAMPTPVKTPVCPMVVCPPSVMQGEWVVSGVAPDLEAVFMDVNGKPAGFALTGKATSRRGALAAQVPGIELPS